MMRCVLAVLVLAVTMVSGPVFAQEGEEAISARVNGGTVGLVSGGITGTYIQIAADLASVLDEGDDLRILPMVGRGSVQNVTDILYLKGVDIGIVQSDTLAVLKKQSIYPGLERRINYITKLYNEELHLVAGGNIRTIKDLDGKKVNLGNPGGGTYMTGTTVFDILGIKVEPVSLDQAVAIEKIKAGEIAATFYVAGKPASVVTGLSAQDGVHLLPIPFSGALRNVYLPSSFSAEDYPNLVPQGERVDTLAIGAVMAVFNWKSDTDRFRKVERFIGAFFSKFDELQRSPRHPKWREVNLAADLPGWTRFPAATAWLEKRKTNVQSAMRQDFQNFLNQQSGGKTFSAAEQEALFRQFLQWRQQTAQ